MQWASNNSNNWNNASLKSYLNGEYYNGINETYKKMISEETYYLGGSTNSNYYSLTASGYYNAERSNTVYSGNPTSTTQYIGLMYPSDYGYASGSSCLSTALYSYSSSCKNSNYLFSGLTEKLQTPNADTINIVNHLIPYGNILGASRSVDTIDDVRPVLYLNTNVQITGGNGSQTLPFELA